MNETTDHSSTSVQERAVKAGLSKVAKVEEQGWVAYAVSYSVETTKDVVKVQEGNFPGLITSYFVSSPDKLCFHTIWSSKASFESSQVSLKNSFGLSDSKCVGFISHVRHRKRDSIPFQKKVVNSLIYLAAFVGAISVLRAPVEFLISPPEIGLELKILPSPNYLFGDQFSGRIDIANYSMTDSTFNIVNAELVSDEHSIVLQDILPNRRGNLRDRVRQEIRVSAQLIRPSSSAHVLPTIYKLNIEAEANAGLLRSSQLFRKDMYTITLWDDRPVSKISAVVKGENYCEYEMKIFSGKTWNEPNIQFGVYSNQVRAISASGEVLKNTGVQITVSGNGGFFRELILRDLHSFGEELLILGAVFSTEDGASLNLSEAQCMDIIRIDGIAQFSEGG